MCLNCQDDWFENAEEIIKNEGYNAEEAALYRYFNRDERWQHFHAIEFKQLSELEDYDKVRHVYEVTLVYWAGGFDKIKVRAITNTHDPCDLKVFDDISDDDLIYEPVRSFTDESCTTVTKEFAELW